MATKSSNNPSDSRTKPSDATSSGSAWMVVLPALGIAACCGGPTVAAWIASAGVVAALGALWHGIGTWVWWAIFGFGVLTVAAALRSRARRTPTCRARRMKTVRSAER